VTLRVARDSGVVAVDVAAQLARTPDGMYSDFVHFTDRGAAAVAAALREPVLTAAARPRPDRVTAATADEP
jgi:hypothetical protein